MVRRVDTREAAVQDTPVGFVGDGIGVVLEESSGLVLELFEGDLLVQVNHLLALVEEAQVSVCVLFVLELSELGVGVDLLVVL